MGMVRGLRQQGSTARSHKKQRAAKQEGRAHAGETVLLHEGQQQRKQEGSDATHRSREEQQAARIRGSVDIIRRRPVPIGSKSRISPHAERV